MQAAPGREAVAWASRGGVGFQAAPGGGAGGGTVAARRSRRGGGRPRCRATRARRHGARAQRLWPAAHGVGSRGAREARPVWPASRALRPRSRQFGARRPGRAAAAPPRAAGRTPARSERSQRPALQGRQLSRLGLHAAVARRTRRRRRAHRRHRRSPRSYPRGSPTSRRGSPRRLGAPAHASRRTPAQRSDSRARAATRAARATDTGRPRRKGTRAKHLGSSSAKHGRRQRQEERSAGRQVSTKASAGMSQRVPRVRPSTNSCSRR